ncbi:DUF3347 domain-containing protein [Sphingobacterium sp. HMA12]|uniref:DUF3347 domain-containing protein n=1 Tax=Sphingobacterium sp. HMA12 TaxID=2050894 RepID=UPI000CEA69A3|nr:DUF3347 domain-containing protein [Sphingobacterium sp. HMA12]
MKRLILIVATAVTLASCNNSKPNHTHAAHTANEREEKSASTDKTKADATELVDTTAKADTTKTAATTKSVTKNRSLDGVYTAYFDLKDALAKDDGQAAQQAAKKMEAVVAQIDVAKLEAADAAAWKQYQRKLAFDTEHIAGIDENGHQREHFVTLSKNV